MWAAAVSDAEVTILRSCHDLSSGWPRAADDCATASAAAVSRPKANVIVFVERTLIFTRSGAHEYLNHRTFCFTSLCFV